MTMSTLTLGAALVAFSPSLALFSMIVYHKAQLVIVVTTAAFFFLLSAVVASIFWYTFHILIGFNGPMAAIIPGVFFQFLFRCLFVSLYHSVEKVIEQSLEKQHEQDQEDERKKRNHEQQQRNSNTNGNVASDTTTGSVRQPHRHRHNAATTTTTTTEDNDDSAAAAAAADESFTQTARLRLQLNDASCGIAAGVGFGSMHAILFYGTLLANQISNNVGVLYQDSCPYIPSIVVSAIYCCAFFVLDIFWMLFTFFGMRRRLLFHRGELSSVHDNRFNGGLLGNNRTGGNLALLFCLISHFITSIFTTADYFKNGCIVSLPVVGVIVLIVAYVFWAGAGRIYLPNEQKAAAVAVAHGPTTTPRTSAAAHHSFD